MQLPTPIPLDQLGAVAGQQYHGDGLAVTATEDGARLRCVFQRLEGRVTSTGLRLISETGNATADRFQVVATSVGREAAATSTSAPPSPTLPATGTVTVVGQLARFIRPGLIEEFTVCVDGVRQDFVIAQAPAGEGSLRVELALTGARAAPLAEGARLVVDGTGRQLAYHRLRAVDALGRELAARLEVASARRLALTVDDSAAAYPVRIDPTFSDADWVSLNGLPGAGGNMGGMKPQLHAVAADGSGNVYLGGSFFYVGNLLANRIAKWDGSTWSAMAGGVDNTVYALAVNGTDLYAGGDFGMAGTVPANHIAKWDGSGWSALGAGVGGKVSALALCGTDLYVGGAFTTAGGMPASRVAHWNGSDWSALGAGMNSEVNALVGSGTDLYAGGTFTTAGVTAANRIAKWDGSAWSALAGGMNKIVYALAVNGRDLYVGGDFTMAGAVPANRIAQWNGSAWSALGAGVNGKVNALAVSGSDLYLGGDFTTAGGAEAANVARWDGNGWSTLDSGTSDQVNALAVSGTLLHVAGNFDSVGGEFYVGFDGTTYGTTTADLVATWDGSSWAPLGSGLVGWPGYGPGVFALAWIGNDLYVGGFFTAFGTVSATSIVKWDGRGWTALGSGLSSDDPWCDYPVVNAMAVAGTDLYVAGHFSKAGGVAVHHIAKWDGSAWSAVGAGVGPFDGAEVSALAVIGTDLFAAGNFSIAGALPVNRIAKWNGSAWSALGSGVTGPGDYPYSVSALAVAGTDLYVGGCFTTAGGVPANNIAKWDGTRWSALGSGTAGTAPDVTALAMVGSDLYVGGSFGGAGGVAATYIAKWDGAAWSPVSGGLNYGSSCSTGVKAFAVSGTDLYAAGEFQSADGSAANRLAKWDGSQWQAMGSGVNGSVRALALDGAGHLIVGGEFTYAGGKPSPYLAQANIPRLPGRFGNLTYSPVTGIRFTFYDGALSQPYRIQSSPSMAVGTWTDLTRFTYTGPIVITDPSAVATPNKFYRAASP